MCDFSLLKQAALPLAWGIQWELVVNFLNFLRDSN